MPVATGSSHRNELTSRLTVDEIEAAFSACNPERLPEEAIRQALARPDELAPRLLASLASPPVDFVATTADLDAEEHDLLPVLAMFLLAAAGNKTAFRPILDFFEEGGLGAEDSTGELVMFDLPILLAATYAGDPEPLEACTLSATSSARLRAATAATLVILSNTGRIERGRVEAVMEQALTNLMAETDGEDLAEDVGNLVSSVMHLRSESLMPLIEACFERGLIEPFHTSREEIEEAYRSSEPLGTREAREAADRQDLVAYLEEWIESFVPNPFMAVGGRDEDDLDDDLGDIDPRDLVRTGRNAGSLFDARTGGAAVYDLSDSDVSPGGTYRRETPKVGRNEPCPCGSGKKYKKCCLTD
jgi:hypothetical protein